MINEENEVEERRLEVSEALIYQKSPLVMFADAAMTIERVRVGAQTRITHLSKRGIRCPMTEELWERSRELEEWVDKRLSELIKEHPASEWFTRIKGTGGEAIAKVIGQIEKFGRYYDVGDPQIPPYVKRAPVLVKENGEMKEKVWVEGIERFTTPSKLRKYAGLVPGLRKVKGKESEFNNELRTMLFRLGTSFKRQKNKYYGFYLDYKARLRQRFIQQGFKIIPTPSGRYCSNCDKEVRKKAARFCPDCGTKLSLKEESKGVIYQGHLERMAMRRMLQLFLAHLWAVWREELGLPLRQPYPIEYLGHTQVISPWEMVDNQPKEKEEPIIKKRTISSEVARNPSHMSEPI